MGLSVMLLMTPAAYHRIVEKGEATEHFYRIASMLLIAAMITFLPGVCGDLYVVVLKITDSSVSALFSACTKLLLFYVAWFGYTTLRRMQIDAVNIHGTN